MRYILQSTTYGEYYYLQNRNEWTIWKDGNKNTVKLKI